VCGRYALTTPPEILAKLFGVRQAPAMKPRYNIAPTQDVPIVRVNSAGERVCEIVKWGLVPAWAKEPSIGSKMINARADSAGTKPAFRSAMRKRRCLVPADGFFEWRKIEPGGEGARGRRQPAKQPLYIHRVDGRPLAFAGLYESWRGEGAAEPLRTCVILTTTPNELMKTIHDRMPVILDETEYDRWLNRDEEDAEALRAMLSPAPDGELEAYPVSRIVNSPGNDDPRCIEPANETPDGTGAPSKNRNASIEPDLFSQRD
jgi:putative SOS response-associated peptidase YedK